MGVFHGTWDLHKEGARDAQRHQDKLKDQFRKKLHEVVSKENIITNDGTKRVRVPIRGLDQYRFVFDQKKQKQTGQGDGDTEKGDIIGREQNGKGKGGQPGDDEGEEEYEAEMLLDDLVEMMMEDLNLPRLDPKKKADMTVPETVWNDISRRGTMGNMAKRRTFLENMKRNAKESGKAVFQNIKKEDIRYKSWKTEYKPITSAVVLAMMDVSGSMTEEKKYIARSFFFWMIQFLKHKYENVEIVFLAHTTTAKIVTEDEFFHRVESGGTMVSSVYEKGLELIKNKYNPNTWNIFAFHFSDGETWNDMPQCVEGITKLSKVCNMVGYGEIDPWESSWTSLYTYYDEQIRGIDNFQQAMLRSGNDVWPTLQKFFSNEA